MSYPLHEAPTPPSRHRVSALPLALALLAALSLLPTHHARAQEPGRTLAAIPVGEKLSDADLRTAIPGHTLISTTPNGIRIEIRHSADGVSTMRSFRADPPTVILGQWEAKDGQFCTTWTNYRDGKELCGVVTKTAADQVRIEYTTGGQTLATVKD